MSPNGMVRLADHAYRLTKICMHNDLVKEILQDVKLTLNYYHSHGREESVIIVEVFRHILHGPPKSLHYGLFLSNH